MTNSEESESFVVVERNAALERDDVAARKDVDWAARVKEAAVRYDPKNRAYAVHLNSTDSKPVVSQDTLENLSVSPQSDLEKTQQIINLVRNYANKNDIIGATVEAIENNVNGEVRLQWLNGHAWCDNV